MKNIFACLAFFFAFTTLSNAQCGTDECVAKINNGYTFLKSYKMEKVGDQMEYSYVFSKDTKYMLVMCASQNITVTLYDSNRKEIATNYDKKNNKFYPAMAYQCNATGIYYLRFSFGDKQPTCCVSVLAFKK